MAAMITAAVVVKTFSPGGFCFEAFEAWLAPRLRRFHAIPRAKSRRMGHGRTATTATTTTMTAAVVTAVETMRRAF